MARLVRVLSSVSAAMWLGSMGLVVMRATEAAGSWATTAATVSVGMASTVTLAAVFLATIPGMLETWHQGVDYGRRLEREERGRAAARPHRHLTTV